MLETLSRPWPWYVAGPIIGLMVPALLLVGGKLFGVSANLRHVCAAVLPFRADFLRYDWKRSGAWNLVFALGILGGGFIAGTLLASSDPVAISDITRAELGSLQLGEPGHAQGLRRARRRRIPHRIRRAVCGRLYVGTRHRGAGCPARPLPAGGGRLLRRRPDCHARAATADLLSTVPMRAT